MSTHHWRYGAQDAVCQVCGLVKWQGDEKPAPEPCPGFCSRCGGMGYHRTPKGEMVTCARCREREAA